MNQIWKIQSTRLTVICWTAIYHAEKRERKNNIKGSQVIIFLQHICVNSWQ